MILSVYSDAKSEESVSGHKTAEPLLLPLENNARLDNQIYKAQGKLIHSEEELSKLMATVHNMLLRYFLRQSYMLVPHDKQPGATGDTSADVDALLTSVQSRLLAASENKLNVTTTASPVQRKLAHGTYTLYLRTLVSTWQCIMSVARVANQQMHEVDRDKFMEEVLHMQTNTNVDVQTTTVLQTYHSQVEQCTAKVEQLRKAAMHKLWAPYPTASVPLDLHVNMFKNYLSQVRAWLQQQPSLALA